MNRIRGKLRLLLAAAAIATGLAAPAHAQKIRVVTTTPELADMAKQVGRDLVDVESLTRGEIVKVIIQ